MADITISTSRQSCEPDCNQLIIIDQPIMNKYSEIDESPSTDTEEPVQGMSVASNTMKLSMNITKMIQNKLKRKKKLSNSLTSVSDTVNQEKRTRIEGIQLNCRGKLNEELIAAATSPPSTPSTVPTQQQMLVKLERVQSRAPLPSPRVAEKIILLQQSHQQHPPQQQSVKVPPPRLKRKLEENVSTIQKLNAQTEQMRLEITELKAHLSTERGAVRVLRAQNESETRKWKNEVKKLQTAMELMRKVKKSKDEACANWSGNGYTSSSLNGTKDANITNHELQRLTNEITTLRETNRNLEEKLQISNDAERRKAADLRELKDSYEIRLTQLSKSAKTEISRLLEEIKTKERNIGQLKKETQTLQKNKTNQTTNNKKDTHTRNTAQRPSEMKKLKDIERNKNNNNINNNNCNITNKNNTNNEKCFINTTCGEREFHSMPHEITERILEAHNDVHAYRSKQDHQNSDSDSALSSAPPSISPQPPPTGMEPADIWQTIRNYTKDIEKVQNDLESIQKENEALQKELNLAKQQILESEKIAIEATNNAKMQQKLFDRVKYLEQKENELQEETHELREQNELLEFRILELEESNDKWSLQSNTTPNSKNVWSNGGKESDDAIIFTDRSDSGVTSPHSHHHIDDRINELSPCDLNLLDHMTNDDLRRRLSQMVKKPGIDEDDKMCLQQVLAFIQNLDVMSHDSLPSSEESSSLEYIKSRVSDYASTARSTDTSPTLLVQKPKSAPTPTGRIVATVLPYSSTVSTPNDSPQRKQRAWHTSSLTESGVFEGDLSESSVYTQTEPEDFACLETATTNDLYTEIQKLNRFREKFEECATKADSGKVPVPSFPSLSPNLSDQKRIQYYKDRLDVLESKLLIYESSGDLQAKRLADRLQREIQLENFVKELRDRVDFLEVENSQLEEEKCEFEEAENDTRLRLQRLEVELEILSQRNVELEMSREALQNKLKDCRSESAILRDDLGACQAQVCNLEEDRCRYKENFEFLHSVLPVLVLFNVFLATTPDMGNCVDRHVVESTESKECERASMPNHVCECAMTIEGFKREVVCLREENRSLKRQINDLNTRHAEAMACADGCWEDLERNYNERLMASKVKEDSLKQKIKQLEECLKDDSRAANEKICQLEEAERELRMCLQKVSRDHREILQEHELITEEYQIMKEKHDRLKEHVDGPLKEVLEREKAQNKNLKDELGYMRRTSCEQELHYRNELDCFQVQLDKLHKELLQIQVTNSELREEVCTLENEVISLQQAKKSDIDKVRCLSDEVRTKEDMCIVLEKRVEALLSAPYANRQAHCSGRTMSASCSGAVPSLAQELNGSPVKRIKMEEPVDLETATRNLGSVLSTIKDCGRTLPTHKQFQNVANDVKKLAEALLANKSAAEKSYITQIRREAKIKRMSNEKRLCNSSTCSHKKSNKKSNKESKSCINQNQSGCWQTCGKESETYYDAIDEPLPQSTASRSGAPENDRHRDHSNLSHQQANEATTGPTQPPAGPRVKIQAKDNDDDKKRDENVKEEYYTPIGSYLCQCERVGQLCSESCSRWVDCSDQPIKPSPKENDIQTSAQHPVEKSTVLTYASGGSSACSCEDDECYCNEPWQRGHANTEIQFFKTIDQCPWTQSVLQSCCRWILEQANKPDSTVASKAKSCCAISKTSSSIKPSSELIYPCVCSNSGDCSEMCCAKPVESKSIKSIELQRSIDKCPCTCGNPENCDKACCRWIKGSDQPQSSSVPSMPYQSATAIVATNLTSTEKLLPLLENIFDVLQSIREEQVHQTHAEHEHIVEPNRSVEIRKYLIDLSPPPPPASPSDTEHLDVPSVPPLNIFDTPRQPEHAPSGLDDTQLMLDPPERDVPHLDDNSTAPADLKTKKLIPVDMDLLRTDADFDMDAAAAFSVECQVNPNSLEAFGVTDATNLVDKAGQYPELHGSQCPCTNEELRAWLEACFKQRNDNLLRKRSSQGCPEACPTADGPRKLSHSSIRNESITDIKDVQLMLPQGTRIGSNQGETVDHWELQPKLEPEQQADGNGADGTSSLKPVVSRESRVSAKSLERMQQHQVFDSQVDNVTDSGLVGKSYTSSEVVVAIKSMDKNASNKCITSAGDKNDVGTDEPRLSQENKRSPCCQCQNGSGQPNRNDTCTFIDWILNDLQAMKEAREKLCFGLQKLPAQIPGPQIQIQIQNQKQWQKPPVGLSFPATIEKVEELGSNSLFVKWTVQDIDTISGYELFLDGHLTNRYFNSIHRAAVICKVNLQYQHRIILRAQPKTTPCSLKMLGSASSVITSTPSDPGACCPQPDGSVWYPSVYHFEPNFYSAPVKSELNEYGAVQN